MGVAVSIVVGTWVAAGSCATGIEPPEPTEMVEIRTQLDAFVVGTNEFCAAEGFPTPSCDVAGPKPILWPQVQVDLAPFAIDVHEVTNIQYEYCVAAGACTDPEGFNAVAPGQQNYYEIDQFDDFPLVNVTWFQAEAYCAFVDKRLPTEWEWERAARGEAYRRFPADGLISDVEDCQTPPAGASYPSEYCRGDNVLDEAGVTDVDFVTEAGQRIYHLFGNAAEWTSSTYKEDVTCKGDPPCTRFDDCNDDVNCENEALACAGPCSTTTCHFLCEGTPRQTIVCEDYSDAEQPLDPGLLTIGGQARKVVRGGSVRTVTSGTCSFRGTYRDFNAEPNRAQPHIGFRCARSL